MLHLVSGYVAYSTLKRALSTYTDEKVDYLKEYFTIGPLFHLDTDEGREQRVKYLTELFQTIHAEELCDELKENIGLVPLKKIAKSKETICLWYSEDTHEQILLRAICTHFPQEKISLINVSQLVKERYRIKAVAQCSEVQLKAVSRKSFTLNTHQYEQYKKEWQALILDTAKLHLFDAGKILSLKEDHYDIYLLAECSDTFTSAAKVIGTAMGKIKENIGDSFLNYRLRVLIEKDLLIFEGNERSMLTMRVKKSA